VRVTSRARPHVLALRRRQGGTRTAWFNTSSAAGGARSLGLREARAVAVRTAQQQGDQAGRVAESGRNSARDSHVGRMPRSSQREVPSSSGRPGTRLSGFQPQQKMSSPGNRQVEPAGMQPARAAVRARGMLLFVHTGDEVPCNCKT
jgi:hypothetical protein